MDSCSRISGTGGQNTWSGLSVGEERVSEGAMNALPCAGRLLWDAAGLREFSLQPSLPMRWAFQDWNTDKVDLSEHVPLPDAPAWVTVDPVRSLMAALGSANTASFHQHWALSFGSRGASFYSSFLFLSVCVCESLSLPVLPAWFVMITIQRNSNPELEFSSTLILERFCHPSWKNWKNFPFRRFVQPNKGIVQLKQLYKAEIWARSLK